MDLLRLEQQRHALEQNLQKLRSSLKHWQTYSAELEGLKEEVQDAGPDLDVEAISQNFGGSTVTEKDIRDLAGLPDSRRSGPQVIGLIARRLDYVQNNIDTLQKQFFTAESKLEELDFAAISASRDNSEGGLPLTEIHEELDDDGNVISSSLRQPEIQTTKIIDALRKAGLSEKDLNAASNPNEADGNDEWTLPTAPSPPPSAMVKHNHDLQKVANHKDPDHDDDSIRPSARKKSVSFTADTKVATEPVRQESEDGKKTVSFNDKVAVMPAAPLPDSRTVTFAPKVEEIPAEPAQTTATGAPNANTEFEKSLKGYTFKPGEKVAELNDNDDVEKFHIVIPENESEEDAATRREMLDYHLNEVGHVVAQMDLDEDDANLEDDEVSDFASSEYLDEDTPYTSGPSDSDMESEDEYGRTKRRVLSDDYHKKMQELERRLIGNLGPGPSAEVLKTLDPEMDPHDARRLVIREKPNAQPDAQPGEVSDTQTKSNSRKRVSFAEALDVAHENPETHKAIKIQEGENAAPIMEVVSERKASAPHTAPGSEAPNLAGKIIADQLMERPTRKSAAAPSEDDSDPVMQRRELAAEYYRRRNEIIRQQGGFKSSEHEDEEPLMEERDGKVKKVSKFKAARIGS